MARHPLSDEVLSMVFAFDSADSRRDAVRDLADRIDAALTGTDIHVLDGMARQWSEDSKAHAETMLRLATVERERDEARAHSEQCLGVMDAARRERDEIRAALTAETSNLHCEIERGDKAVMELSDAKWNLAQRDNRVQELALQVMDLERERDVARAECDYGIEIQTRQVEENRRLERERDEARSRSDMFHGIARDLQRERDEARRLLLRRVEASRLDEANRSIAELEAALRQWCRELRESGKPSDVGHHIAAEVERRFLSAPAQPANQCDGCQAGRPVDANGNHRMSDGAYPDLMRCQRGKYAPAQPATVERCGNAGCELPLGHAPAQPATPDGNRCAHGSDDCGICDNVPAQPTCTTGTDWRVEQAGMEDAQPATATKRLHAFACPRQNEEHEGHCFPPAAPPSPAAREATGELSFTREEHDKFMAAVDKLPVEPEEFAESSRFYCDNCGTNVTVDDDALCATCGGSTCTRLHVPTTVISSNRDQSFRAVVEAARDLIANLHVERRKEYVTDSRFVIPLANALAELCLPGTADALAALDAARSKETK